MKTLLKKSHAILFLTLRALFATLATAHAGFAFLPGTRLLADDKVEAILIEKQAHQMTLLKNGIAMQRYPIALGRTDLEIKTCQGDNRTPEGSYTIDAKLLASSFHRALHISYPNAADIERSKLAGCQPGGEIMIHGMRNGLGWIGKWHHFIDWTRGCIAVTDSEIEEIWDTVPVGTTVEIRR